jgi:chorismate mutase
MKKEILIAFTMLFPLVAQARLVNGHNIINGTATQGYGIIARFCRDISCVQQNIQFIDTQIANLIAQRLAYVERGALLKNSAVAPQNDQLDPNVILQVTRQAQFQGYPPEIAQAIFKEIDKQSRAYESRYRNLPPTSSPGTFSTPTPPVVNIPYVTPTITPGVQP